MLSKERQNDINSQFWQLSEKDRKTFIYSLVKRQEKKRQTAGTSSLRKFTFKYFLKKENGSEI